MPKLFKRGLFLFILVVLPVTVIMFLQLFGENKFDLPVYFESEAPEVSGCTYMLPHKPTFPGEMPTSELGMVIAFLDSTELTPELERLGKLLNEDNVFSLKVYNRKPLDGTEQLTQETFNYTLNCEMAFSYFDEEEVVIPVFYVDELGRIRGFYRGEDKKEVDRLITELEIIERYHE